MYTLHIHVGCPLSANSSPQVLPARTLRRCQCLGAPQ